MISYTASHDFFFQRTRTQCKNPKRANRENCGIGKRNYRWREISMRAYILQVRWVDEYIKHY